VHVHCIRAFVPPVYTAPRIPVAGRRLPLTSGDSPGDPLAPRSSPDERLLRACSGSASQTSSPAFAQQVELALDRLGEQPFMRLPEDRPRAFRQPLHPRVDGPHHCQLRRQRRRALSRAALSFAAPRRARMHGVCRAILFLLLDDASNLRGRVGDHAVRSINCFEMLFHANAPAKKRAEVRRPERVDAMEHRRVLAFVSCDTPCPAFTIIDVRATWRKWPRGH